MRASKNELQKTTDTNEAVIREAVWGEMNVEYDIFKEKVDMTPLLKGLPNDRDQCPHWGIVVKGQVTIICDGKTEVAKPGDAFYFPPGHTGIMEAGTEYWGFSPAEKLKKTKEVIKRNMEAMQKKK